MLQFDAQQELEIGQIDRNILQASALVQDDLEYADTSAAYCVEAKQMWKGIFTKVTLLCRKQLHNHFILNMNEIFRCICVGSITLAL